MENSNIHGERQRNLRDINDSAPHFVTVCRILSGTPAEQTRAANSTSAVRPFLLPGFPPLMTTILIRTAPLSIHNFQLIAQV